MRTTCYVRGLSPDCCVVGGAGCLSCVIMILVKKEGWLHKLLSWSLKTYNSITVNEIRIKTAI